MARGFVAGGLAFTGFALVCTVLTGYVPMWLVSRAELVDRFCWFGEGIFSTSYRWGDDLPTLGITCTAEAGLARSSYEAYCQPMMNPTLDNGRVPMTAEFRREMCSRTTASQALLICAIFLACMGMVCGFLTHITRKFYFQLYCSVGATSCCTIAFILQATTLFLMQTSPLFGDEHIAALSRGFRKPYQGTSCLYQMPTLASILHQRNYDGRMQCLFPGPSFAFSMSAMVGFLFAGLLFGMKLHEANLVRRLAIKHHNPDQLEWSNEMQSPLFASNVVEVSSSNDEAAVAVDEDGDSEADTLRTALLDPSTYEGNQNTPGSPGIALPSRFRFGRHYSLYGAFMRRTSRHGVWVRHLINAIPPLMNIAHACILGFWVMKGTAFATIAHFDQLKGGAPHHGFANDIIDLSYGLQPSTNITTSMEYQNLTDAFEDLYISMVEDLLFPIEGHLWLDNVTVKQHIIEFSPITTLHVFFGAKAFGLGIAQLVSVFLWPILKVLIWAMFWYAPADETFRGRIYAWVDIMGKISLANLYMLVILSLSNYFERTIYIPWYKAPLVIRPLHKLRVRMSFGIQPGFGIDGYTLSFILSLLMGEANVAVHRFAKSWEEKRRDEEHQKWQSEPLEDDLLQMSVSRSSADLNVTQNEEQLESSPLVSRRRNIRDAENHASTSLLADPLFSEADSPYQMMTNERQAYRRRFSSLVGSFSLDVGNTDPEVLLNNNSRGRFDITSSQDEENTQQNVSFAEDSVLRQMEYYKALRSESCQNHIFSPTPGEFYRCSRVGKVLMFSLLILTLMILVSAIAVPTFTLRRSGLVGKLVIPPESQNLTFSVLHVPSAVLHVGLEGEPPHLMAISFFVFVIVMPLFHVLVLAAVWIFPWSPKQQLRLMNMIEVVNAWSGLDIFCIMLLFTLFDLRAFTTHLIENAGFKFLDEYLEKHNPELQVFTIQEEGLLPGYALLVFAVLLERILGHIIQLLFATMIAERRGVRDITHQTERMGMFFNHHHMSSASVQPLSNQLLRAHMSVLSPVANYFLASALPDHFYAGIPLTMWRRFSRHKILVRDFTFDPGHNLGE